MAKMLEPAVAYLRASSAANVGADKDSDKSQLASKGSSGLKVTRGAWYYLRRCPKLDGNIANNATARFAGSGRSAARCIVFN